MLSKPGIQWGSILLIQFLHQGLQTTLYTYVDGNCRYGRKFGRLGVVWYGFGVWGFRA